jgi:hypothetical protein
LALRLITFVTAVGIVLSTQGVDAMAAGIANAEHVAPAATATQEGPARQVDDNADTRVGVQLAVLGVAAFVVVVIGGVGYVIRRRLGLDKPPAQEPPGHH